MSATSAGRQALAAGLVSLRAAAGLWAGLISLRDVTSVEGLAKQQVVQRAVAPNFRTPVRDHRRLASLCCPALVFEIHATHCDQP